MIAVSKDHRRSDYRPLGMRVHRDVIRALKVAAAMRGESMEATLQDELVRIFQERGILPANFAPRKAKARAATKANRSTATSN